MLWDIYCIIFIPQEHKWKEAPSMVKGWDLFTLAHSNALELNLDSHSAQVILQWRHAIIWMMQELPAKPVSMVAMKINVVDSNVFLYWQVIVFFSDLFTTCLFFRNLSRWWCEVGGRRRQVWRPCGDVLWRAMGNYLWPWLWSPWSSCCMQSARILKNQ